MDPLVDEYRKNGVGTIKNEVTLKSLKETKEFAIKLGIAVTAIWSLTLLRGQP